jgi:hypothetical protein
MHIVMDHLQCAEECLKLAQRTNDPQYKKRLEGSLKNWRRWPQNEPNSLLKCATFGAVAGSDEAAYSFDRERALNSSLNCDSRSEIS